jgi:hypothetical protein
VIVPLIQSGISRVLVGIYNDDFVRTPDGWRFQRLHFTPATMIDLPTDWKPF